MSGRDAQRARTRKAIVRAAAGMLERGERPDLEAVAAEAGVSRATAYRYFPGIDALLSEAAVDALMPEPGDLFDGAVADPAVRLAMVDAAITGAIRQREMPLRLMLAQVLERSARGGVDGIPLRQNRRTPLIEKALEPLGPRLSPENRQRLIGALAMVIGSEGHIALKDVLGLEPEQADAVRQWAITALLGAALAAQDCA